MAYSDVGHYYDPHSEGFADSDSASSASALARSPSAPSSVPPAAAVLELALGRPPDDGGMVIRREDEKEDEKEEGVNMGSPYPGFVGRLTAGHRVHRHLRDQRPRVAVAVAVGNLLVLGELGQGRRTWGFDGRMRLSPACGQMFRRSSTIKKTICKFYYSTGSEDVGVFTSRSWRTRPGIPKGVVTSLVSCCIRWFWACCDAAAAAAARF